MSENKIMPWDVVKWLNSCYVVQMVGEYHALIKDPAGQPFCVPLNQLTKIPGVKMQNGELVKVEK